MQIYAKFMKTYAKLFDCISVKGMTGKPYVKAGVPSERFLEVCLI